MMHPKASFLDYTIGIFLLCLGLFVVWYIFSALFIAGRVWFHSGMDSIRVRGKISALKRAEAALLANRLQDFFRHLESALELEPFLSAELLPIIREHHQNIVDRLVSAADDRSIRLENIARVERLFFERLDLQTLLVKASDSYVKIRARRQQVGKDLPEWSHSDFEMRIRDIRTALETNAKELRKEFPILFSFFFPPPSNNITYH